MKRNKSKAEASQETNMPPGADKAKKYGGLDDLTKIGKQWVKLSGLHSREEWSAAVVRAATAAELATTYAIRQEFRGQGNLTPEFIDEMLKWANGIQGKFQKLLIPLIAHQPGKKAAFASVLKKIAPLNTKRNEIAHGGHFCGEREAQRLIDSCHEIVLTLVQVYYPNFVLKERAIEDE